jgi:hypothetical protein
MNSNDILPAKVARRQELISQVREYTARLRSEQHRWPKVKLAVECGKALIELKGVVEPGGWICLLQNSCGLNRMTANRYMRLARRADVLTRPMWMRQAYILAGVITPKSHSGNAATKPL